MEFDVEDIEQSGEIPPSGRRVLYLVAAAAIAVAGLAVLSGREPAPNQAGATGPDSLAASPAMVADSLMAAVVEGDGQAAASLFSPEATVAGIAPLDAALDETLSPFEPGMSPALNLWHRAVGQSYGAGGCALPWQPEPVGQSVERVTCRYSFTNELISALSIEPIEGSVVLAITGGRIEGVSHQMGDLSVHLNSYVWDLFSEWIRHRHPSDFKAMYVDDGSGPLLDSPSVTLWKEHTEEFVASATQATRDYVARVGAICSSARARLNEELVAAGIEMEPLGFQDPVLLGPVRGEDYPAYREKSRRFMGEAVADLRNIHPPDGVPVQFDQLFRLMESQEIPDRAWFYWSYQSRRDPSLQYCAFSPETWGLRVGAP